MEAILWGYRKIENNYPGYDFKEFSVFRDVIERKVEDMNNSPRGIRYEIIKITIEKG